VPDLIAITLKIEITMKKEQNLNNAETQALNIPVVSRSFLSEEDLVELGFEKRLMLGTGYISISSMRPAQYYYKKGRITINATEFWTWFLDGEQRNDIAVSNKDALRELLQNYG